VFKGGTSASSEEICSNRLAIIGKAHVYIEGSRGRIRGRIAIDPDGVDRERLEKDNNYTSNKQTIIGKGFYLPFLLR
jgi:hypothetical protein